MAKPQRIRDPVHDLIEFGTNNLDQMAWRALDSREFQRLRRIKQLGLSELVFPGATHTRFAHSVGVFHMARRLTALLKDRLEGRFDEQRAEIAQAAALVHDLGHGPFSHSFEDALKRLGIRKRHEEWTAEIVTGDTRVCEVLSRYSDGFQERVAELLASETPVDIYSAVVSSQFDADRLDYVRRDRLMTGAQHGGFDFPWLMANLEVDRIAIALDGEQVRATWKASFWGTKLSKPQRRMFSVCFIYILRYIFTRRLGRRKKWWSLCWKGLDSS